MATKNAAAPKAVLATKSASAAKSSAQKTVAPKTAAKTAATAEQKVADPPKSAKKPALDATTAALHAKQPKKISSQLFPPGRFFQRLPLMPQLPLQPKNW